MSGMFMRATAPGEDVRAPTSHFAVSSDGAVTQWVDLSTYLDPPARDVVTIAGRRYALARKPNGEGYSLRPLDGR